MWRCDSEGALRRRAWTALALLALGATLFGVRQNYFGGFGGPISAAKLFWLAYAVLYWFLLPAVATMDQRAGVGMRRIYALFLANMSLRGTVELWMIYGARNWHPHYGAVHDLLSAALVAWLASRYRSPRPIDLPLRRNLAIIVLMLLAEAGFALYFAAHFHTAGERALYFVPAEERYAGVLYCTWLMVAVLTANLYFFGKRWLYGGSDVR